MKCTLCEDCGWVCEAPTQTEEPHFKTGRLGGPRPFGWDEG
jgi:hypothetical protein